MECVCIQVWDQGEARLRMYAKSSLLFSTGPIKYRAGRRYMSPTLGRSWKALYHCYNLTADIEKKIELKKNSNNKNSKQQQTAKHSFTSKPQICL